MFLVGSLTSLFPYALTIIAMFFCIFTGAPVQQQLVRYTTENVQEYSASETDNSQHHHYYSDNILDTSCHAFHLIPKQKKSIWILRPFGEHGHVAIASSGNKAPPTFDII